VGKMGGCLWRKKADFSFGMNRSEGKKGFTIEKECI